jgi:Ca-activated chloride channel family protein
MTDGENTSGTDFRGFATWAGVRPAAVRDVPVFCVLFGESSVEEMEEVARLTGGRTFDARTAPLAEIFQEIRGYV